MLYEILRSVIVEVCDRAPQVLPYINTCSFDLHEGHDSTRAYNVGWKLGHVDHALSAGNAVAAELNPWVYRSAMELDGVPYPGEVTDVYIQFFED